MSLYEKKAIISECGRYRYALGRTWTRGAARVTWIMLNPSTADDQDDDATIRRCAGYARRWGFGGIDVVNLYAWRATDWRELLTAVDPIGPLCNDTIRAAAALSSVTVCAWGNHPADVAAHTGRDRVREVLALVARERLHVLATTKKGHPHHPLRLPASLAPAPFRPEVAS